MRLLPLLLAFALISPPLAARAQTTPVVLELYTSQGCSSCPPADKLLHKLSEQDGVIALALHVDYWDYLGWKDAFGKPAHSARQRAYAKAARARSVYTPQMVVQGDKRLKGHDAEKILGEIAKHRLQPPMASIELGREASALKIRVEPLLPMVGPSEVHVVRFIPSERVKIEAGENAGRELTYTNIVADWQTIAQWDGETPLELEHQAPGDGPLAVIVQRSSMGPIVTAAEWP